MASLACCAGAPVFSGMGGVFPIFSGNKKKTMMSNGSSRCVLSFQVCAMRPYWDDRNGRVGAWVEFGGIITGDWLAEGESSEWFDYNDFPPL